MSDIFLSYTEQDRDTARRIAEVLGSAGWNVWWDRRIPAGETWRSVLEHALQNMRCMVVLWSAKSIESEWVYEEATEGRRLGKLVPVMIEAVRPPAGFREIQAADLSHWDGSREFEGLRMLLADLENLLGKPLPGAPEAPAKAIDTLPRAAAPAYDPADLAVERTTAPWWRPSRLAGIAVAGLLVLAAAAYLALSGRQPQAPVVQPQVLQPQVVHPERQETRPAAVTPPAPAPVVAEASSPPVVKTPSKTLPPSQRAATPRASNPRCADLLAKIQLGESLSYEAQAVFQKECQQ